MEFVEEMRSSKKKVKGQSFEGVDRVTMEMIGITDVPVERSGQLHNAPALSLFSKEFIESGFVP